VRLIPSHPAEFILRLTTAASAAKNKKRQKKNDLEKKKAEKHWTNQMIDGRFVSIPTPWIDS